MDKGWIFPYDKIIKNSKIILYGAGKIGMEFKCQVDATDYCKIVAWTDINYRNFEKGLGICSPEKIRGSEYDFILIAVKSQETTVEIVKRLKEFKVDPNKIITINDVDIDNAYFEIRKKDFSCSPDTKHLDIAFVVPNPIKGGGGHRNIFRAVRYLSDFGHKITVYIFHPSCDADCMKKQVSEWFYPMKCVTFVCNENELGYHDAGIATSWETVYVFRNQEDHFRNIFYFVQDFEPYFSALSSGYYLAENTYKLGYAHICSGPWIDKILRERYQAESRYFQFPLDTTIYNTRHKRNKKNSNIVFFAKPEMPRRCFELGVEALRIFKENNPETEIIMFGSTVLSKDLVPFEATILNYVSTLRELAEIYTNADLGIVFSPTNPSLVPYEMMSCGCPVIDLDVDLAIVKYGNDRNNVFLLEPFPEKFASALEEILENKEVLKLHRESALKWVTEEFPTELEMAQIVEDCIIKKISTGSIY